MGRRRDGARGAAEAPSDSYVRMRAASCLDGSFVVEAGAGTGKTALIMERLKNIICSGDVSMDGLVAITFTEKAAAELKARLRIELERLAATGQGARAESAVSALREMDRAVLSTIHSFCSALLRERPVEAGVDPGFRVADEVEAEELLDAAWERWLQSRMTPDNRRLRPAFSMGANLTRTRELAGAVASHRDMLDWAPGPLPVADPMKLMGLVAAGCSELDELMSRHLKNPEDRLVHEIEKLRRFVELSASRGDGDGWENLLGAIGALRIKAGRTGNAANWSSKGALARAREIVAGISEKAGGILGTLGHNALVGLMQELNGLVDMYQNAKRERGVLDFNDLLIGARDLLRDNPETREYFKRKFKYILIDEFQDTDPLQAEVAFFLAERKGDSSPSWRDVRVESGKLFIVGDPKQSIYRFRGADIEVYERSKEVLARSGEVLNISVNFRSTPGIVEPVNIAFERAMRAPEEGLYQPDYVPLDGYRRDGGPGLVLLRAGEEIPERCSADERRAYEASAVAWSIRESVQRGLWTVRDKDGGEARPAGYGDMAVLFWATTGLGTYEEALRSCEIPYRVAGGKAFYSRAEVQSLVTVLSAVENPHDEVAVVGALRSPFFGLSDEEILLHWEGVQSLDYTRMNGKGPARRAFAVLRTLRDHRNRERLGPFLSRLFEATGVLPVLYMRPHGEQRVANLLKISTMASRLEGSGPVTFKRFVRWVADQGERGATEGESPIREAGEDFVTVLTIHKAKGLEFPVVFIPGLWSEGKRDVDYLIADRGRRDLQICLSKGLGLATAGWEAAAERESRVIEAERVRLLYVAMTRARDRLVMPCMFGVETGARDRDSAGGSESAGAKTRGASAKRKREAPISHLGALLGRALAGGVDWCETLEIPSEGLKTGREKALRTAGRAPAAPKRDLGELNLKWRSSLRDTIDGCAVADAVTAPTSLLEHIASDVPAPGAAPWQGGVQGRTGRKVGTLVHAVLDAVRGWDPDVMVELAASMGAELGLGRDAVANAREMLRRFAASPLAARARAARRLLSEVPFCVGLETSSGERFGGEAPLVEGAADLLMEEEDGWRVVDFKTDAVGPEGLAARVEHYRLQGACYALCLSKVLNAQVKEVLFYFLSPGLEHVLPVDDSLLREAEQAVARRTAAAPGSSRARPAEGDPGL
jgi:ATP-dependent helicase/nuclease subunit A